MAQTAPQRQDRRSEIANALYRCICEKGFANTSLKDISEKAGMTPSHVAYYFDNKASILEYYAEAICRRNTAELPALDECDLEDLIDRIADFCMGEGQMSVGLLGVIQELTGLAVHDPKLHAIKADHARVWREYLEAFFERARPGSGLSPRDAAHRAHAMLVGLNTNSLFDRDLEREAAHRLFRDTLRALTNQERALSATAHLETRRNRSNERDTA